MYMQIVHLQKFNAYAYVHLIKEITSIVVFSLEGTSVVIIL